MLTDSDLSGFTGTTSWYRHPLMPNLLYTDGVQYMAEKGDAYWLIDAIFSYQGEPPARTEEFQVWTLQKLAGTGATLIMTDGNSEKPLICQHITFTDFPLNKITLWFANQTLYLPSEH